MSSRARLAALADNCFLSHHRSSSLPRGIRFGCREQAEVDLLMRRVEHARKKGYSSMKITRATGVVLGLREMYRGNTLKM